MKPGKVLKVGKDKYTAIECETTQALKDFVSEADYFNKGSFTGKYTGKPGDVTLTYAAYEPWSLKADGAKNPLVIWVHGGGEGGVDVSITLLGNEVVALARPEIQSHFTTEGGEGGAYVLSIQCPTMWMGTSKGFGHGEYPSLYANVLKACIDEYVDQHPDVDRNRIYLGGCSNGGYMTMVMAMVNGNKYDAYVPICEAILDSEIDDTELATLKGLPIYFIHAENDTTVDPLTTSVPTYNRLVAAEAENVHTFTPANVEDMTGQFKDADGSPYDYAGHWSWVYFDNNDTACDKCNITAWDFIAGVVNPK